MTTIDTDAAREARRAARRTWPGRVYRDGAYPEVDASHLSSEERISAVWTASRAAWLLAGHTLPDVPRSEWPGVVLRAP